MSVYGKVAMVTHPLLPGVKSCLIIRKYPRGREDKRKTALRRCLLFVKNLT